MTEPVINDPAVTMCPGCGASILGWQNNEVHEEGTGRMIQWNVGANSHCAWTRDYLSAEYLRRNPDQMRWVYP